MYELSTDAIAGLNQVIEAADRILRVRGEARIGGGLLYRKPPFAILAAPPPGRLMRLIVAYAGETVLDVTWQQGDHGHVAIDAPGPWRGELLALPVHDA